MALRLVEAIVPSDRKSTLEEALSDIKLRSLRTESISEGRLLVRVLVEAEGSDAVVGALTQHFEHAEEFEAVILAVEAALPRPPVDDEEEDAEEDTGSEESRAGNDDGEDSKSSRAASRVSVEELHAGVMDMSRLTPIYLALVVIATIVAAIGLRRDSPAIVIGSMVIAPLLGPSVALALATTLADWPLGRHALKANVSGFFLCLTLSFLIGLAVPVDPSVGEIASRTFVGHSDVVLGLAVGGAGVLSVTTGVPTALVGVMVAVALLPPLVVAGLLAGSGYWAGAWAAGLLIATYVITINLAGVLTFFVQGVKPRSRWEAERAKKATRVGIFLWVVLVGALATLIALVEFE
ncbi:MAG: TIGR00341 family protein [Gemmatimonadota bacterium]